MNWHNKLSLVLFLLLPISILSCDQTVEPDLVGINNGSSLQVKNTILSPKSFMVREDSIFALKTGTQQVPMGVLKDDFLGVRKSNILAEMRPSSFTAFIAETNTFVSAKIVFRALGHLGNQQDKGQKFTVHQLNTLINDGTFTYADISKKLVPGVDYDESPVASVSYNYETDRESVTNNDVTTLSNTVISEAPLDEAFGRKLFELSRFNSTSFVNTLANLQATFKGVIIIPDDQNTLMSNYDLSINGSFIEITSSKTDGTTETYKYTFEDISSTERLIRTFQLEETNGPLTGKIADESIEVVGDLIGMSHHDGSQIKISLDPLRAFIKDNPRVKFNSVNLVLNDVVEESLKTDSLQFIIKFVKDDNKDIKFVNNLTQISETRALRQYALGASVRELEDIISASNIASFNKVVGTNKYQIDFTLIAQAILNGVVFSDEDLLLTPTKTSGTSGNKTYERIKVRKDDIRINVIYSSF